MLETCKVHASGVCTCECCILGFNSTVWHSFALQQSSTCFSALVDAVGSFFNGSFWDCQAFFGTEFADFCVEGFRTKCQLTWPEDIHFNFDEPVDLGGGHLRDWACEVGCK